jgi:hypothetical protein
LTFIKARQGSKSLGGLYFYRDCMFFYVRQSSLTASIFAGMFAGISGLRKVDTNKLNCFVPLGLGGLPASSPKLQRRSASTAKDGTSNETHRRIFARD